MVLFNNLASLKFNEQPGVSEAEEHSIEPHEETLKDEQALGHHADFNTKDGNAVVGELVLVKHHVVKEENRVRALELVEGYFATCLLEWPVGILIALAFFPRLIIQKEMYSAWMEVSHINSSLVISSVCPIVRLHNLLNILMHPFTHLLPGFGVRNL